MDILENMNADTIVSYLEAAIKTIVAFAAPTLAPEATSVAEVLAAGVALYDEIIAKAPAAKPVAAPAKPTLASALAARKVSAGATA